jgi:hypothetical protein
MKEKRTGNATDKIHEAFRFFIFASLTSLSFGSGSVASGQVWTPTLNVAKQSMGEKWTSVLADLFITVLFYNRLEIFEGVLNTPIEQ